MNDINSRSMREIRTMEGALWTTWGKLLMDGRMDEDEFRERLVGFAVDSYRIGLLTAANMIERRLDPAN